MKEVGAPMSLKAMGVPEDGLPIAAFHSMVDPCTIFNPRPITDPGEVLSVFQQAF
jgi:alcohol dehydrogenase class IV